MNPRRSFSRKSMRRRRTKRYLRDAGDGGEIQEDPQDKNPDDTARMNRITIRRQARPTLISTMKGQTSSCRLRWSADERTRLHC